MLVFSTGQSGVQLLHPTIRYLRVNLKTERKGSKTTQEENPRGSIDSGTRKQSKSKTAAGRGANSSLKVASRPSDEERTLHNKIDL